MSLLAPSAQLLRKGNRQAAIVPIRSFSMSTGSGVMAGLVLIMASRSRTRSKVVHCFLIHGASNMDLATMDASGPRSFALVSFRRAV